MQMRESREYSKLDGDGVSPAQQQTPIMRASAGRMSPRSSMPASLMLEDEYLRG